MDPYSLDLRVENVLGRVAHIEVVQMATSRGGRRFISPELRTIGELEYHVKRLKDDLDRILATGRREFAKPQPPLELPDQ